MLVNTAPFTGIKGQLNKQQQWSYLRVGQRRALRICCQQSKNDSDSEIQAAIPKGFGVSEKKKRDIEKQVKTAQGKKKRQKKGPAKKEAELVVPKSEYFSEAQEAEVVSWLIVAFLYLILAGIALAATGFLPEEWDDFITAYIYPSYPVAIVVFFAISSVFGVVKAGNVDKVFLYAEQNWGWDMSRFKTDQGAELDYGNEEANKGAAEAQEAAKGAAEKQAAVTAQESKGK